jgi:predicted cupin superfamily sugar epimerase
MSAGADDIIRVLGLQPHPEGGYFRETFRDPRVDAEGRAGSTAIYFLLKAGEVSRWHRVDAVEVWHWYAGAALELKVAEGKRLTTTSTLGSSLREGQRPQAIVPAHHWQCARSLGAWSLAGCTVAPGFEFSRFELADATFQPTS